MVLHPARRTVAAAAPVRLEADGQAPIAGEAVRPGEYFGLFVSDAGHDMDAATLRRAFEPFFTTKGPGKGTGLGLSMVCGVVRQSGGHVRASSTPGQGTRVEIYLPMADATDPHGAATAPRPARPASGRVLLAKDDPMVREVIVRELQAQGYDVVEAGDGVDALALAGPGGQRFDAVSTDLGMPRMDGRELAGRLGESRPSLPVLFISGHPDETAASPLSQPGRLFLQKPFAAEELIAHLQRLLGDVA